MPQKVCGQILSRAGGWFLRSGIQDASGGVARYHLIAEKRNARVSTEITGYAVSAYLELFERTKKEAYLQAARRAGDLLCRAWDEESAAMPFEWSRNGAAPQRLSYFFDTGIIVRGLLRLWRQTGEDRYFRMALLGGESMERDFCNGQDAHPIVRLPDKTPVERDGRWSRSSGCYQLKAALGMLELAQETGERRFELRYEETLRRGLATHHRFLSEAPDEHGVMDRLHAYCYFLEGLLPRAERPEVEDALRDGIARAAVALRRVRPGFERSDVNGQLLRVRLWADEAGAVKLEREAAEQEARWAAQYQMRSEEARLDGAFNFGRRGGVESNYANPVSTAFCVQALAMWEEYLNGGLAASWRRLV